MSQLLAEASRANPTCELYENLAAGGLGEMTNDSRRSVAMDASAMHDQEGRALKLIDWVRQGLHGF